MGTIYIKTTDTCNLNCSHCFTNGRNGLKTEWDWQATQGWVKDYLSKNEGPMHLELHGGEPFLVPIETLDAFCEPFKNNERITIGATTNLVYKLYPENIEFIKTTLNSRIATSWDINIRFETEKQYELWKKNLRTLLDNDIDVKILVSITKDVIAMDVEDFIARMQSYGAQTYALERLTSSGAAIENTHIFPDNDEQDRWYLELLKKYQERDLGFSIQDFDILIERLKNNVVRTYTNCRDCEQRLVTISASGSLAGCPNASLENKFGTINDPVEYFLGHDARLTQIAKELDFDERCLSCDMFQYCGGDCHRLSWHSGRCGGLYHTLNYLVNGKEPGDRSLNKSRVKPRVIPIKAQL